MDSPSRSIGPRMNVERCGAKRSKQCKINSFAVAPCEIALKPFEDARDVAELRVALEGGDPQLVHGGSPARRVQRLADATGGLAVEGLMARFS